MNPSPDNVFRQLVFLVPFDQVQADEARARGYLSHVLVETAADRLYPVTFYDPVRLRQDLDETTQAGNAYVAEPGMIVVPEIAIALMEAAARGLCTEAFFAHMRSFTRQQLALSNPYEWPPRISE